MGKCEKHGCEMVVKHFSAGWGDESKYVCPECKKEEEKESKAVFTNAKPGWQ